MKPRLPLVPVFLALACALSAAPAPAPFLELVSVKKIWDYTHADKPYNSFGDLVRFHQTWYCCFREARMHMPLPGLEDNGEIRILTSADGDHWETAAVVAESGIDLRDPHLCSFGKQLILIAGGAAYPGGVFKSIQPRIAFSSDGHQWSAPQRIMQPGRWLWRVTAHDGKLYGVGRWTTEIAPGAAPFRHVELVSSADGLHWTSLGELHVPGGDEATIRFLPDGRMVILMRCEVSEQWKPGDKIDPREKSPTHHAAIGVSAAPFTQWDWHKITTFVGGPNFIVLPDGRLIAGGRWYKDGDWLNPKTAIGPMTFTSYEPQLVLPSAGDSSYPAFVWHKGELWVLYYSSHDHVSTTAIFLAKVRVK